MSTLNFRPFGNSFQDVAYAVIARTERKFNWEDLIPRDIGDGHITIGAGLNLDGGYPRVRFAAYRALGIRIDIETGAVDRSGGTSAQQDAEQAYVDRLNTALIRSGWTVAQKVAELHNIMAERAGNTVLDGYANNRPNVFSFSSSDTGEQQIRQSFNEAIIAYDAELSLRLDAFNPTIRAQANYANSWEHAALLSLTWNGGPGLIGADLMSAIANSDRAEAWYQIRYVSNRNQLPGLAKRRYYEAEMFGLYDNPGAVSLDAATNIYRMFSKRRSEISAYEKKYGIDFDGNLGSHGNRILTANSDYKLNGADAVDYIHEALTPAYQTLFADIASRHVSEMSGLSASDFSPVDLLVDTGEANTLPAANLLDGTEYNTDGSERKARNLIVGDKGFNIILKGGGGDDVLIAGAGNDILDGGTDNDKLYAGTGTDQLTGGSGNDTLYAADGAGGDILDGGNGDDTYYADEGDTIRDSDGKGTVYLNGKKLSFALKKKGNDYYLDGAGNEYRLVNGKLEVGDPLIIEGFDNGELGIYLDEEEDPTDPNQRPKPPGYNPNNAIARARSPLALDINGNGRIDDIGLSNSTVYFDLTNDGIAEKTGWLAPGDGLVGMDMNGNGVIDNRDELFGTDPEHTAFDRMRELVDANGDGIVDNADPLYGALRVWQDANSDGISQAGELKTLAELGILSLDAIAAPAAQTTANGNRIVATAGYVINGERRLAVDIEFAYDASLTDANPNRPQNLPPTLDAEIFDLPWLRGYGNVKSLPIACQENPELRQAAAALAGKGWMGILAGFEGFMAQWTGLKQAHASHGVTRTYLSIEDKVWMLENLTGQNVYKGAIEAASFGNVRPAGGGTWNVLYVYETWNSFVKREAMSFAIQTQDWLKGASYSLNRGRFIVLDEVQLVDSVRSRFNSVANEAEAGIATSVVLRLMGDGIVFDAATLKAGLTDSPFKTLFETALDQGMGNRTDMVVVGGEGNDTLAGGTGDDILMGGAGDDALHGGNGDDIYVFGRGYGRDTIVDVGSTTGVGDTIRMVADVTPEDVTVTRSRHDLYLSLNNGADRLTLANWFYGNWDMIESVVFADGTRWNATEMAGRVVLAPAGENADALFGSDGDDLLDGLGGNDYLSGEQGNDTLYGGAGNDTLEGGAGNDTYLFGRGDGQDTILSYDGNPAKQDVVQFKEGVLPADVQASRQWDNLILKIAGTQDQLTVQQYFTGDGGFRAYGVETIRFDDGSAWEYAAVRTKVLAASEGNDALYGHSTDDAITGLGGNDQLYGAAGNDTLDGGAGNDTLDGGAGNDTYLFGRGDGQDTILSYDWSPAKQDVVQFKADVSPSDVVASRQGDHLILKIAGTQDQLTVQHYFTGDGGFRAYGVETIRFDDGSAWDYAAVKAKVLVASEGNDALYGFSTDDAITGLGGNDQLYGAAGNDTLDGGAGNDTLDGGAGNDTYLFGRGDGQDTILSYDWSPAKQDVVQFKADVSPSDVVASRQGDHLILKIAGTQDQLTVQHYFTGDGGFRAYGVETIRFDDGSAWDYAAVKAKVLVASEGNDALYGFSTDDAIAGLGGNDQLNGAAGDDTLDGGAGNDTLDGGAGNDTYLFGRGDGQDTISSYDWNPAKQDVVQFKEGVLPADVQASRQWDNLILRINGTPDQLTIQNYFGNDGGFNPNGVEAIRFADGTNWDFATVQAKSLAGSEGDDVLYGGSGNDTIDGLAGNDHIEGRSGNDTLSGGAGYDTLNGGAGNDTYLFGPGSGQDQIVDYDVAAGNIDTIRVADGVSPTAVKVTRDANHLYLNLNNGADRMTLQNWFGGDAYKIERVVFGEGTEWSADDLQAMVSVIDGGDNFLDGTAGNDMLEGLGGNDRIHARGGNDTLDGGAGNDMLDGGTGNDTYLFGQGGGQDTISSHEWNANKLDTVQFDDGIAATDVSVSRQFDNLILNINGTQDQLTILNYFSNEGSFNPYGVESIRFVDGTNWDFAAVKAKSLEGTEGDDTLFGGNGNDAIDGLAGNDILYGQGGNDTLKGAAGNDMLNGGAGNDTYLFGLGDGQDVISSYEWNANKLDTVQFGEGIAVTDVSVSRQWDNLILKINGTPDQLAIQNYFSYEGSFNPYGVEAIRFADGTNWDFATLKAKSLAATSGDDVLYGGNSADTIDGLAGNDTLLGQGGNDSLTGGSGNDSLYGDASNDTLDGGAGNDYLRGGTGSDTYLLNAGDGEDRIFEENGAEGDIDTLRFGAGIAPGDIVFARNGDDLILTVHGSSDQVRIQGWRNGDAYRIDGVVFNDGTLWDKAFLLGQTADFDNLPILGTTGSDYLVGDQGNNTLQGSTGNDILLGEGGSDTYLFELGDGEDTIIETDFAEGNLDALRFGAGIAPADIILARNGGNLVFAIRGTTDQVSIFGWNGSTPAALERVSFADGTLWDAAYLQAQTADLGMLPVLGTSGNEALVGSANDDTYMFVRGGGQDTIVEGGGGFDTLRFGDGIAAADIVILRTGSSLVLRVQGSPDQVTIQNWNFGSTSRIEQVAFADGTLWDSAYLAERVAALPITGSAADDTLYGDEGANVLEGGTGNDFLLGGLGGDTYVFNLGDGKDTVIENDPLTGGTDTLQFGSGIEASQIVLSRSGNDFVMAIAGTSDRVTFRNWAVDEASRLERVLFSDGTSWNVEDLRLKFDAAPIQGTPAPDQLYGSDGANILIGAEGNDALYGGGGNDSYLFNLGDGQDVVHEYDSQGTPNEDTLRFGQGVSPDSISFVRDGADLIVAYGAQGDTIRIAGWGDAQDNRVERMEFADGTAWNQSILQSKLLGVRGQPVIGTGGDNTLYGWFDEDATLSGEAGNDQLYGNDGNDLLHGGTGADYLVGGEGNDVYLFNPGDGQDTIAEWSESATPINTLRFGAGIGPGDLSIGRYGADVVLSIVGTEDQVILGGWGNGPAYRIQRVEFADGTHWDETTLGAAVSLAPIVGTANGDSLFGDDGDNIIDSLAGDDFMDGGTGSDTYVFGYGYGQDIVRDSDATQGNVDSIRLLAGVAPQDVTLTRDWVNLYLSLNGGADRLTIANHFSGEDSKIERVVFDDGTIWGRTEIDSHLFVSPPTESDDTILGSDGVDVLSGLGGNDLLVGSGGNDILDGGSGNDTLSGDGGDDMFLFGYGDGQDTIANYDGDPAKHDVIVFKSGVLPGDVLVSRTYADLVLSLSGSDDKLTVSSYFIDYDGMLPSRIDEIRFADGTSWGLDTVRSMLAPVATNDADNLFGFDTADVIDGLAGDDYIAGAAGADELNGGEGNDTIEGGAGDDLIAGDAGDDYLDGGAGRDVYLYETGDGADTIFDLSDGGKSLQPTGGKGGGGNAGGGGNELRFGPGITSDQVVATIQGSDVVLSFRGTPGSVRLASWIGAANRVDTFGFSDGTTWDALQVESIMSLNVAPDLLHPLGALDVVAESSFSYLIPAGSFQDPNPGDALTYSAQLDDGSELPGWLQFDAANRRFDGAPSRSATGVWQVRVTATDTFGVSVSDVVTLNVANPNTAPIPGAPLESGIATQGQEFSYALPAGAFIDPDVGDSLALSALLSDGQALPPWLSFDPATGGFSGTPANGDVGTISIVVKASDRGGLFTTSSFDIAIGNVNDAPALANSLQSQEVTEGMPFAFTIPIDAFSDPDKVYGDTLTLSARLADGSALPGWLLFDAVSRTFSGTPQYTSLGNVPVVVTATDSGALTANGDFILTVAPHGAVNLVGTAGADILSGFSGDDTLDGAAGADTLIGGLGNDTYVVDVAGDVVTELANEGIDTVRSAVTLTLAANVENLVLTGTAAINGTGNTLNNTLTGNTANNTLNGGAGADTLIGGAGNDTYVIDDAGDVVTELAAEGTDLVQSGVTHTLSANVENLTLTGSTAINGTGNELNNVLTGNSGANTLTGGAGNDTLNGGAGADTLIGGLGNDTYTVDSIGDVVVEQTGEGTDRVNASITYALGSNLENLTLTGSTAINGTGNELANALTGNSGANTLTGGAGNDSLNGGAGADTLIGGLGNDTYTVDNVGDVVTELADEGIDLVNSSITHTLAANVENLTLTGSTAISGTGNELNNALTGNSGANTLNGGAGNDTLNGGAGADTLIGGLGNDTYTVDNIGDVVTELADEGTDLVQSSITHTLAANVENLTLTGSTAINGTGNELANVLTGNSGANTLTGGAGNDSLNGGSGADTMLGGLGDDVYTVDNASDVVTELAGEGIDLVNSSVTLTLAANVEALALSGSSALNGTGNAQDNLLRGNTGANTLNGGTGNDLLEGGAGNDVLTDTAGTALFNGGAGTDTLTGGAAAELYLGGLGNDTVTTAGGNDVILFNKGDGQDSFATGGTGNDTLSLGGGIAYTDLSFSKATNDLVLKIGASDQITFKNWYAATPSKPVLNLQMIAEAMADFSAGGSDPLKDQKIENFNFAGLAGAFDAARVANPGLTSWALTNALTSFQLAGSDTAAIGGDLAYQYGKNGTLSGIGLTSAQQVIGDAGFGTQAQTLRPLATIQEGAVRLS